MNCAGVAGRGLGSSGGNLVDLHDEEWDFVMNINLKGLMHCLRAELRVIENKGSVVNISSILGVMGKFILSLLKIISFLILPSSNSFLGSTD